MKAAAIKEFNSISIEEMPIPEVHQEEALIKVQYFGICGTDNHVFTGKHPEAKPLIIPGHEFVGELVNFKSKNSILKQGDKVLVQPLKSCGICDSCIQGRENICKELNIFGLHINGCFCEYISVPINKVYKLPNKIDLKTAALAEPLAVAVHDIRRSNFEAGQTAFIIGGGPIGLLIAMVARLNGASKILISEINEYREEFIKDLGFNVLNPLKDDIQKTIDVMTEGKGFDAVFEVSGSKPAAELMTVAVKNGGKIIYIGVPSEEYPIDLKSVYSKEIDIKGVRIHSQINFAAAVEILKSELLKDQLSKLITNEFKFYDIQKVMEFSVTDNKHFKILVKM